MTAVYLKYHNGTALTAATQFSALEVFKDAPETERIIETDLRGTRRAHLKWSRSNNAVIILPPSELIDPTKWAFIKNFYVCAGNAWQYSLDNVTYYDVVLENAGKMPLERLENNKNLRTLKLELTQKNKD